MVRLMRISATVVLLSAAPAFAAPAKIVKLVTIANATYKVRIKGDNAEVARQAMALNANTDHWIRSRQAAEIASGCTAAETFPVNALLMVKLDCTQTPDAVPGATVRTK